MQNRFLLGVIFLTAVSALLNMTGLLSVSDQVVPQSYLIFYWCSLILIVANSPMFNELKFNRFFQSLFLLAGVGTVMKILHWPYAEPIFMGSLLTAGLGYAYRFWEKPDKGLLDILKVLWVVVELTARFFRFNHFAGATVIAYIAGGLFFAMLGVFLYQGFREGWLLSPSENADIDDQNPNW